MLGLRRTDYQAQLDSRAVELAAATDARQVKHEDACSIRWIANESKLDQMAQQQLKLHAANAETLGKILRYIYIGIGVALAVGALGTPMGNRFARLFTTEEVPTSESHFESSKSLTIPIPQTVPNSKGK